MATDYSVARAVEPPGPRRTRSRTSASASCSASGPSRTRARSTAPPTALDYTQSAVSQHVDGASRRRSACACSSAARGRRTVALTEAGALLLRHVVSITDRLQAARADLHGLRGGRDRHAPGRRLPERRDADPAGDHRPLRRGRGPTSRSASRRPSSDEGLLDLIEPGIARRVVRRPAAARRPVRGVELVEDPFVAVVAAGVAAGRASADDPAARPIGAQRLIGFRSCRSTRLGRGPAPRRRHRPNFVFRSEDNGTVQAMAGAGLGIALVPLLAVDTDGPADRASSRPTCRPAGSRSCGTATATARRRRDAFVEMAPRRSARRSAVGGSGDPAGSGDARAP